MTMEDVQMGAEIEAIGDITYADGEGYDDAVPPRAH